MKNFPISIATKGPKVAVVILVISMTSLWALMGPSRRIARGDHIGRASASSTLKEKRKPADFYGARRALDGRPATAWCAGKKSRDGLGAVLTVRFPRGWQARGARENPNIRNSRMLYAPYLMVSSGYAATRRLYYANNRIRRYTLRVFYKGRGRPDVISGRFPDKMCVGKQELVDYCSEVYPPKSEDSEQVTPIFAERRAGFTKRKCLRSLAKACVPPPRSSVHEDYGYGHIIELKRAGLVTRIEFKITGVYRGRKYRDTCVSDILFGSRGYGM